MGRLSKIDQLNLAYIAGFLDGDGSIMLQLHRRKKEQDVFRVKTVICFYQDKRHSDKIEWFKQILGCGYIYIRNDNICELRIEGFEKVFYVLSLIKPFVRFKKKQVDLMLRLIPKLQQKVLLKGGIESYIRKMREYNYFSSQRTVLVNVPVTTDMEGTR